MRRDLEARLAALAAAARAQTIERRSRLDNLQTRLQGLSPLSILDRGYALIFDEHGKLVKTSSQVKAGEDIRAKLAKGELRATVKERRE
jgi:exodeoxyribonuclease VII large subunit